MQEVDYIIVGQGLAGSVLSFSLIENNQRVLVVDEDLTDSSSKIAAGLCNPVVFKRMTKSWMVEEVLSYAIAFYQKQENLFKEQFYIDIPIYKLFADEAEQNFWQQKSNDSLLFDWVDPKIEYPFDNDKINYPFGAAKTLNSGFLKTSNWLDKMKEYFIKNDSYVQQKFNYNDIEFLEDCVVWKNVKAKKIIFCEGYECTSNPYFDWLPFKLTKGEVLTVQFKTLKLEQAINKGVFVLPYDEKYKLGATYNWDELNNETTEKGKEELLLKAAKFIKDEIIVIKHQAGVRPTVKDRRPLLGIHPQHHQLAVFNGLGTKGVMLAPYFANKMVHLLLKNEALPNEVDIQRFTQKEA